MQRVFAVQRLDHSLARSRQLLDALDRTKPAIEHQTRDLRTPSTFSEGFSGTGTLTPLEGQS
jgi:hypothetical protein